MLIAVPIFPNRPIYDSIQSQEHSSAQRGACPVAKKPILENGESHQAVVCLANANFGLGTVL
jgi:hypothetical protein